MNTNKVTAPKKIFYDSGYMSLEWQGETYETPSYFEVAKHAPAYLLSKAAAGDNSSTAALSVFIIDSLPEGEFQDLLREVNTEDLGQIIELWVGGSENLGKF